MTDEVLIEIARRFGIEPSEYYRAMLIAAEIFDGTHPNDLPGQMIKYMSRHECSQNMKLAIAFNIGLLVGSECR
jgi:hypothetical protein